MAEVTIESLQAELKAEKAKNAELQGRIDELQGKFDVKEYLKQREAKDAADAAYQTDLEKEFI